MKAACRVANSLQSICALVGGAQAAGTRPLRAWFREEWWQGYTVTSSAGTVLPTATKRYAPRPEPRRASGLPLLYSSDGATRDANAFRALFNRDFTVPRLHEVISAISS